MRVKKYDTSKGVRYVMKCPGCKSEHAVDDSWNFNGDFQNPTFSPSILVTEYDDSKEIHPKGTFVCHSYVKNGRWEFLSDCDHELAGKTIELPEFP